MLIDHVFGIRASVDRIDWDLRLPEAHGVRRLLQHLATHQAAGTHQQQAATLILQLPPGHAQAVAAATA